MPAVTLDTPVNLPLFAPLTRRSPLLPLNQWSKDCRLYNGYVEPDPDYEGQYQIYKRPGYGTLVLEGQGAGQGVYTISNAQVGVNVLSVSGGKVYYNSVWISSGFVLPDTQFSFAMSPMLTGNYAIVLNSQQEAYLVDVNPNGNTATMSLLELPATGLQPQSNLYAGGIVQLDGTTYIMDVFGEIWGSNVGDPTTWSSLNKIVADSEYDPGVYLAKHLNYVIALKQYVSQVFYDAGNSPGSPLGIVQDAQLPYGCSQPNSVQSIDQILIWLSTNQYAHSQIITLNNLSLNVVSTPGVERILNEYFSFGTNVLSWTLKYAGHRWYGITSVTNNFTLVYDIDVAQWFIWTDPDGNYWPISCMSWTGNQPETSSSTQLYPIVQQSATGNLYQLAAAEIYPTDNGQVFPVDLYTPNYDAGVDRRKQLNMLRVWADQQPGSNLYVRCSDDDYQSWSNYRTLNLGLKRPALPNCGTFYRRAYHFHHAEACPLRIRQVSLQMDVGTL